MPVEPPHFPHIHCSSRWDRPASALEKDLDNWMQHSSIVTLTELTNNRNAATLREKGWDYFNSKLNNGQDDVGIAWKTSIWKRKRGWTVKLTNIQFFLRNHRPAEPVYAATVLLKHATSGHEVLVSCAHLPAHVEGAGGWRTTEYKWKARKDAYIQSHVNWSGAVRQYVKETKPDSVLVVADYNLNLKEAWVRQFLQSHWAAADLKLAWTHFPGEGGTFDNRIIDGTMYRGLKIVDQPDILGNVASSDHRPYRESFKFTGRAGTGGAGGDNATDWEATGGTPGVPWWGFGDYAQDELYIYAQETEDAQGNAPA